MTVRGLLVACAGWLVFANLAAAQPLPPVPFPPQNPLTEAKRVLGKMLFWDEQLSSDNTVSCATCHSPGVGGGDARRRRAPGFDALLNTPDDVFGSPGVIQANVLGNYVRSPAFGFVSQVTGRSSQSYLTASYAPQNFWDGRASGTFRDPITNAILIPNGGALESQAVGPILNSVEMAHMNRDWLSVAAKLQNARPMALATGLQSDVAAALTPATTYANLFQAAFGDPAVTPARIAFAIATYERTVYPNDTPFDRTQAGQPGGLTPQQQQGLNAFNASNCNLCHVGPQFTGNGFRNVGLRPPQEDQGLQLTTLNPADRGKFKVPSLRNVGLKNTFMHNGQFTTLLQVIQFYARAPGAAPQFPDNQDPLMQQVNVPPPAAAAIEEFLRNGLTDARVANQTFPFDRATLWSQRPEHRVGILGNPSPGSGGFFPQLIAETPPMVGNADFKLGVRSALGGASARLILSTKPPIGDLLSEEMSLGPITLNDAGNGNGFGTIHWDIPDNGTLVGRSLYFQWLITDPAAAGGVARSAVAQATFFCAGIGCSPVCFADLDNGSGVGIPDGAEDITDLVYFLTGFELGSTEVDLDNGSFTGVKDNAIDINDLLFFLIRFEQGC
jgi:cytochrome c peroxidase